jgi:hypothetical protein
VVFLFVGVPYTNTSVSIKQMLVDNRNFIYASKVPFIVLHNIAYRDFDVFCMS